MASYRQRHGNGIPLSVERKAAFPAPSLRRSSASSVTALEAARFGATPCAASVPSYTARQRATREQAAALGIAQMVADLPS
ncbi:hypothetical protein FHS96_003331 [Sphingomonas zeicaulis]|uniref:hypothetical protein n=1 Tax=Sphingomonas zeicaulis TaxID=1632740 RepID=UPI003D204D7C